MLLKILTIFSINAILITAYAQTESNVSTAPASIPDPIVAVIQKNSFAGDKPSSYCVVMPNTTLKAGRIVVLIGERECRKGYKSEAVLHYEVIASGKRLFVEKTAIQLLGADQERIRDISRETREQYFSEATELSLEIQRQQLDRALKAIDATRKAGLTIIEAKIADVSRNTEGTSFTVRVSNPTDKAIKYIWFTVVGYNAVNDPVSDRLKGGPALTVKAIGPIEKDETGSYRWEYMWHTDIVQSFKIPEIKIQYMDNTTRLIRDWKAITLSPQNRLVLEGDE